LHVSASNRDIVAVSKEVVAVPLGQAALADAAVAQQNHFTFNVS
jgi:hypothetical protein